jgi:hypothetical protein
VTVEDGDPVNTVIAAKPYGSMALVNTANERKPGGDWESGFTAAEECLARRSTLTHALKNSYQNGGKPDRFYPIPQRGAIYSPHVGMGTGVKKENHEEVANDSHQLSSEKGRTALIECTSSTRTLRSFLLRQSVAQG